MPILSILAASSIGLWDARQTPTQAPTAPQTPVTSQTATYSLKYAPIVGSSLFFKMTGDMQILNDTSKLTSKIVQKVTVVDPDGTYSLETDTLEGTVQVAGQVLPMPKSTSVSVYKPSGEAVSVTSGLADPTIMRSVNLTLLKRPDGLVKLGDTWAWTIKSDSATKAPSLQGTYTFEGEEVIGSYKTLRIESKVNEGETPFPGSVIASFWIDKADGSLVKWDCQYTSVTFPGATSPLSGHFQMLRVDK